MSSEPTQLTDQIAIDDPHRIVKVVASDGKTSEQRELAYTNCKVIGNGSFGVVFQARLIGESKESEDIAIKKVLQDKRFKVHSFHPSFMYHSTFAPFLYLCAHVIGCADSSLIR